ncbi:hypothetical protein BD413DRAFT_615610 [Trametes elegans]|nr:hypothetical protein BD413DRAFT_615610 [Trametes elegans]
MQSLRPDLEDQMPGEKNVVSLPPGRHVLLELLYSLTDLHIDYFCAIKGGVDGLVNLLAASAAHAASTRDPRAGWNQLRLGVYRRRYLPKMVATLEEVLLHRFAEPLDFWIPVAYKFLFAPRSPEDRSRRLHAKWLKDRWSKAAGKRPQGGCPAVPEGHVRVKWYPDLEAPFKWPSGLGDLYQDLALDTDGSLDLTPLLRLWGMENCYVLNAASGRRISIGRDEDDRLSALTLAVRLDGHSVVGVVEQPTPTMQAARRGRTQFKESLKHDPLSLVLDGLSFLARGVASLSQGTYWTAVTLEALVCCLLWRVLVRPLLQLLYYTIGLPLIKLNELLWSAINHTRRAAQHCARVASQGVSACLIAVGCFGVFAMMWLGAGVWGSIRWCLGGIRDWTVALFEAYFLTPDELASLQAQRHHRTYDSVSDAYASDEDEVEDLISDID